MSRRLPAMRPNSSLRLPQMTSRSRRRSVCRSGMSVVNMGTVINGKRKASRLQDQLAAVERLGVALRGIALDAPDLAIASNVEGLNQARLRWLGKHSIRISHLSASWAFVSGT